MEIGEHAVSWGDIPQEAGGDVPVSRGIRLAAAPSDVRVEGGPHPAVGARVVASLPETTDLCALTVDARPHIDRERAQVQPTGDGG